TRGRRGHARTGSGSARPPVPVRLGRMTAPALAWCGTVVAAAVAFPLATLAYWLATGQRSAWDLPGLADTATATLGVAAAGAAARPGDQERPLLVVADAVLFLPLAVTATRAAVLQSPPVLEDVARSLGHGPLRVLRTVTLPLAAPGVAAGAALTFVVCMKEL